MPGCGFKWNIWTHSNHIFFLCDFLCMTNKGKRFGQVAFPRNYLKKGIIPLGTVLLDFSRVLGKNRGISCYSPQPVLIYE